MSNSFPLQKLQNIKTPFYYYDMELLERTLKTVSEEAKKNAFVVHYAIKSNANARVLEMIRSFGLGVDIAADRISSTWSDACRRASSRKWI